MKPMSPRFVQLVLERNSKELLQYLDFIVKTTRPRTIDSWFRTAAMLPGNWSRNAWLNLFYEIYVPEEFRKFKLSNHVKYRKRLSEQEQQKRRVDFEKNATGDFIEFVSQFK